jgi:hypothetical protein
MVNLKKVLLSVDGKEYKKSFCRTPEEKKDNETVENVILNCLATFSVTDKKQIFYINAISTKILNAENGEVEFTPEQTSFLDGVLWKSVIKEGKKDKEGKAEQDGIYFATVIAQVLLELGIKE